jgi:transcriptional regulator of nitric oxide reductase
MPLDAIKVAVRAIVIALVAVSVPAAAAKIDRASADDERLYKSVFPDADIFSVKGGARPHAKAYKLDPGMGDATVVGFVFRTNEVEPDEWAYASQLEILVGLTTAGKITAVRVIRHYEPYGYFSIDRPEFAGQFEGKSILDAFEVGEDVDDVSRATITVDGAGRVIKKSTRRILQQHLAEQKGTK